jgi:hypothetical protein
VLDITFPDIAGLVSQAPYLEVYLSRTPFVAIQTTPSSLLQLVWFSFLSTAAFPVFPCPMACMPLIALGEMRSTLAPDQAVGSDTLFC